VIQVPSITWRMLSQGPSRVEIPRGLDRAWHRAAGAAGSVSLRTKGFIRRAESIVSLEKRFSHLSDKKLREMILPLRDRFCLVRDTAEDQNRAFAIIREVAERTIGMRPFTVQVACGLAMESGCIAEMATGEGKTLAATMPAVLAGWRNRGCHVVTANEYLAARDAGWMAPIYRFCGLTVGWVENAMGPALRRQAYAAHITYCTSQEVAADFLRDRLTLGHIQGLSSALLAKLAGRGPDLIDGLVQRSLGCAIIDEADAVLVDEAVTPLIISGAGQNPDHAQAIAEAALLAAKLSPEKDYRVDRRHSEITLTAAGKARLAGMAESLVGLWGCSRRREEIVVQATTAREFFIRDKQYVVDDQTVVIIDEFSGRLMPDRTWRDGLHQAVEAKEGLEIHLPRETLARISFQRFFRLYGKLSGMTGTAAEIRNELWQIYHLPVVVIPPRRACKRSMRPDRIFSNEDAKWRAVIDEIRIEHETGRPVLVGTRSVEASESLSRRLTAENLDHEVLNAVRHDDEARIIADAGRSGRITVATNMAGRGTDIRLGPHVAELGGLHVVATERHEARRIDRQLYGRCARQGDPGSARAFVSLDDELLQRHAPPVWKGPVSGDGDGGREITSVFSRRRVERAQRRAERAAFYRRREVLRTDHWLDEHLGFALKEI
jgi:preprotein translocase subunit SecA